MFFEINPLEICSNSGSQIVCDVSVLLTSTFLFLILRFLLYYFSAIPKSLKTKCNESAYWFNVLVSMIHSTITGTWCLLCFYNDPEMASDLINGHGRSAHILVTISTGYFLYDVIDNIIMLPLSKSWEILLHHAVVSSCFGISVFRHQYVGYAVVALLVEVNSVFLHMRMLFRLSGVDKKSQIYRVNCIVNLGTFVLFRICTLTYMTRWLVFNKVAQPFHGIAVVGMALMTIMNAVLFIRLLIKDCFGQDKKYHQGDSKVSSDQIKSDSQGHHVRAKIE
ncbi:TLC domain-containing protein 2-like [Styela clava]